jgi:hypothetical protein
MKRLYSRIIVGWKSNFRYMETKAVVKDLDDLRRRKGRVRLTLNFEGRRF